MRSAKRGEVSQGRAEQVPAEAGWRAGSGLTSGARRIGCQVRGELAREWRVYDERPDGIGGEPVRGGVLARRGV